jgi:pilus assembly protein CpaB
VLLGIAFFVVGGIIVFLLTDDDDGDGAAGPVPVVVSNVDIPAGTLANDLIEQGRLKQTEVSADNLVPGAIQSLNQLTDATFVQGFAAGQQLTSGGLQLQNRTFEVPEGFEAVAIQVDFVEGGAGYVTPGDHINLYGTYDVQYPLEQPVPRAQLLLSNVEVLDVNLSIPPRRGTTSDPSVARASTDTVTFLVALRAPDAEKVIYNAEFQGLYASLVADDAPPVSGTPGRDGDTILAA